MNSVVIHDQSINKSKICMCDSTYMRTTYLASCRRKFITKLYFVTDLQIHPICVLRKSNVPYANY